MKMMEPVICPGVNQPDLNHFDEVNKMGKDIKPITVNVFDSGNAEAPKMRTKLSHDEASWLEQMQITPRMKKTNPRPVGPILFEKNNVRVSKKKLKDILLTGQFALADLELFNSSERPGNKKEGRIVIHQDSIDHLGPLIPNQKEYSGQSESGDGAQSYLNGSHLEKTVTCDTSTVSTDTTLKSKKPPCMTKKDKLQFKSRPLPRRPDPIDEISGKAGKSSITEKSADFKRLNVKCLVERQTQTDDCIYEENIFKELHVDKNPYNSDLKGYTDGRVEATSQTEIAMAKPDITLCDLKQEEIKRVKKLVKPEYRMDTNEGKRIWAEVDAMIKRSLPKGKLRNGKQKLDTPSVVKSGDGPVDSIEFHSRFPRYGNEYFNFVPKDHMWSLWNADESNDKNTDQIIDLPVCNRETTFDRVYGQDPDDISLYQHMGRFGEQISEYDANFNFRNNGCREKFFENIPLILNPMERKKYEETLRALDRDHGYPRFDPITMTLIHPVRMSNSAPASTQLPPNGACRSNTMMMATTLPRLTPAPTPLPTGITQPPPRSHSSASMYMPYPPKDLSSSMDFMKMPGRINPLKPPPPRKRINWSWETVDQHHENEKRRLLMQKREHTRYHSAWSKAFYGAPAEKEAYRRHYREVLKQQMNDQDSMKKEQFQNKIRESERTIAYDRKCQQNDATEFYRKHNYLQQFRDGNKQQMEDRWAQVRTNKNVEDRIDRERLRYNPINWSCSLK